MDYKLIKKQIQEQTRPQLGNIELSNRGIIVKDRPEQQLSISWLKTYYSLVRAEEKFGNMFKVPALTLDDFYNTDINMSQIVMPPQPLGMLSDPNIPIDGINAMYSVFVYNDNDVNIKGGIGGGGSIFLSDQTTLTVYVHEILNVSPRPSDTGNLIAGNLLSKSKPYVIYMSDGYAPRMSGVNFIIPAKIWVRIIVLIYCANRNASINGFFYLNKKVISSSYTNPLGIDTPKFYSPSITTSIVNELLGIYKNTIQWEAPSDPDWYGNGIYKQEIESTNLQVGKTVYTKDSKNSFIVNSAIAISKFFNRNRILIDGKEDLVIKNGGGFSYNLVKNGDFASVSGQFFSSWNSIFNTSYGYIIPVNNEYLYNGYAAAGYSRKTNTAKSIYLETTTVIPVSTATNYIFSFSNIRTIGSKETGLVQMFFYKNNLGSVAALASTNFPINHSSSWLTSEFTIFGHSSSANAISGVKFLPYNCSHIKLRLLYSNNSTSESRYIYDGINLSDNIGQYILNSETSNFSVITTHDKLTNRKDSNTLFYSGFDNSFKDNSGKYPNILGQPRLRRYGKLGIPSANSTNLLSNPSFENGISGWSTLGGVIPVLSSTIARTSAYSLKMAPSNQRYNLQYQFTTQTAPGTYVIQGFMKLAGTVSTVSGLWMQMGIKYTDTTEEYNQLQWDGSITNWQSGSLIMHSNLSKSIEKIYINLFQDSGNNGTFTAYFDDISLRYIYGNTIEITRAATNKIKNGSFDFYNASTLQPSYWKPYINTSRASYTVTSESYLGLTALKCKKISSSSRPIVLRSTSISIINTDKIWLTVYSKSTVPGRVDFTKNLAGPLWSGDVFYTNSSNSWTRNIYYITGLTSGSYRVGLGFDENIRNNTEILFDCAQLEINSDNYTPFDDVNIGGVIASQTGALQYDNPLANSNLVSSAEALDNSKWVKTVTITANNTASPRGDLTAERFNWNAANQYIEQTINKKGLFNTFQLGIYLKRKTGEANRTIRLILSDKNTTQVSSADISVNTSTWKYFKLKKTFSGINSSVVARVRCMAPSNGTAYAWGAQLYSSPIALNIRNIYTPLFKADAPATSQPFNYIWNFKTGIGSDGNETNSWGLRYNRNLDKFELKIGDGSSSYSLYSAKQLFKAHEHIPLSVSFDGRNTTLYINGSDNLLALPNDLSSSSAWEKSNVETTTRTSPIVHSTMATIVQSTTNPNGYIRQSLMPFSNGIYSFKVWLMSPVTHTAKVGIWNSGFTVGTSKSIKVTNIWNQFEVTANAVSSNTAYAIIWPSGVSSKLGMVFVRESEAKIISYSNTIKQYICYLPQKFYIGNASTSSGYSASGYIDDFRIDNYPYKQELVAIDSQANKLAPSSSLSISKIKFIHLSDKQRQISEKSSIVQYEDYNVKPGNRYVYSLDSYDRWGNRSKLSNTASILTGDFTPPAPVSIVSTSTSVDNITLEWTNPASGDFKFSRIYNSSLVYANKIVDVFGAPGTSMKHVIGGLTEDTQYTFFITTFDQIGNENRASAQPIKIQTTRNISGANILSNGSFEVNILSTTNPSAGVGNWISALDYELSINRQTQQRRSGNYSLWTKNVWKTGDSPEDILKSCKISINTSEPFYYTISFYGKRGTADGFGTGKFRWSIVEYSDATASAVITRSLLAEVDYLNTATWARYYKTIGKSGYGTDYSFNNATKSIRLCIKFPANGVPNPGTKTFYFDDFQIERDTKNPSRWKPGITDSIDASLIDSGTLEILSDKIKKIKIGTNDLAASNITILDGTMTYKSPNTAQSYYFVKHIEVSTPLSGSKEGKYVTFKVPFWNPQLNTTESVTPNIILYNCNTLIHSSVDALYIYRDFTVTGSPATPQSVTFSTLATSYNGLKPPSTFSKPVVTISNLRYDRNVYITEIAATYFKIAKSVSGATSAAKIDFILNEAAAGQPKRLKMWVSSVSGRGFIPYAKIISGSAPALYTDTVSTQINYLASADDTINNSSNNMKKEITLSYTIPWDTRLPGSDID